MALSPQQVSEKQKLDFPTQCALLEERVDDALLSAQGEVIFSTVGERKDVVVEVVDRFQKVGWDVGICVGSIVLSKRK